MFQTLKCTIYRIKNPQTVHIHMQDNTLFIFFKAANAPTGSFGLMWIQMQVHTVCCKDIGFLGGAGALRNLILTEICHFTDFGSRNALWGDFFFPGAHVRNIARMQVFNIALVQMAYYGPSVCVNTAAGQSRLRWPQWKYRAGSGTSRLQCYCRCIFFFFWWHCGCPHDCLWKILFYLFKQKNATSPNSACFSPNVFIYLFIYLSTIECCCIWIWVRTRA